MSFFSKVVAATGLGTAAYSAWNACQSIGSLRNAFSQVAPDIETITKLALEKCKAIPYILPSNAVYDPSAPSIPADALFNDESLCMPPDLRRITAQMMSDSASAASAATDLIDQECWRLAYSTFLCLASFGIAFYNLRNRASKQGLPTTQD